MIDPRTSPLSRLSTLRRWWALWCVVAWTATAGVARAAVSSPRLVAAATTQIEAGEFETAEELLLEALKDPDNGNADLVAIYWRLGEVHVFLQHPAEARGYFDKLLVLDAGFEPPRLTSPRVRQAFEQTRDALLTGEPSPELAVTPRQAARSGEPIALEVQAVGTRPGQKLRVFWRPVPSESWRVASMDREAGDGILTAELPAQLPGVAIEYYAELQASDRRRVQGDGSAGSPYTLRVAGGATTTPVAVSNQTWWRRNWPWVAGGGAAVVVGGLVAYLLTRDDPPATLTIRLQ